MVIPMIQTNFMITIYTEKFNSFLQNDYDTMIENCNINKITCPHCGHIGSLRRHGTYIRHIKISESIKIPLYIKRFKCTDCNHTHAILPSTIIPYFQISCFDVYTTIKSYFLLKLKPKEIINNITSLDYPNFWQLIHIYLKYWKAIIESYKISLNSFTNLIISCFEFNFSQFMQIHCTKNILFIDST